MQTSDDDNLKLRYFSDFENHLHNVYGYSEGEKISVLYNRKNPDIYYLIQSTGKEKFS